MNDQKIPILLNCVAAFLGALGQYFYKKGSAQMAERLFNLPLLLGVLLFCGVMVLFVIAYKLGGKISIVYPFYATTFIWGTLIGVLWEKETVRLPYYLGLGLVLAGLTVIAMQLEST
jgi:drug/metabolite transporter (DMT)-like permease